VCVCVCTLIMGLKLGISVMMGSICMDHRSISVRSMEGCVLVLCCCVWWFNRYWHAKHRLTFHPVWLLHCIMNISFTVRCMLCVGCLWWALDVQTSLSPHTHTHTHKLYRINKRYRSLAFTAVPQCLVWEVHFNTKLN